MSDLIDRQAAIDAPEKLIKDCNPDHFIGHHMFIEFMDNAEIGSFGNWQYANGFNMGLTAAEVAIKELPSVDAVSVVRCVDCVRWNTILDRTNAEYGLCQIGSQLEATKNDDFCSKGERRTDATN